MLFHLNYFNADMSCTRSSAGITYASTRTDQRGRPATVSAHYSPVGEALNPQMGTLEHFLTERYCLYAVSPSGATYRLEIHHRPWLLQAAEARIEADAMLTAAGLHAPRTAPLLHFSSRQPMIGWASRLI